MRTTLTTKQQEALKFIANFIAQHGESPTISELAQGLGLKSLRSVTQRLEILERKGFIKRDPFKHKGIKVLNPITPTSPYEGTERIPVIASAGCDAMQVYAQETFDEFLNVDHSLLDHRKNIVAIKAVGNSMIDFGLRNGDYALVEVTDNVQSGDRVVAILGEMAVIKRFKQINGMTILEPESKGNGYSPIILNDGLSRIFGKVLKVIPMSNSKDDFEYIPL